LIVADTSAFAAILFSEEDALRFIEAMFEREVVVAAPSVFKLSMVHVRRRNGQPADVDALLERTGARIVAWTHEHARIASDAFLRFGKGHHAAKLNFGDCMAYALAKSLDAPLLYKGNDFALTDIRPALA